MTETTAKSKTTMNLDLIDKTLYKEENEKLTVYPDTSAQHWPTVGIGHKVLPEDNLKVGDTITPDRSRQLYQNDRNIALHAALSIFPDFNTFPDSAQTAIVSIIFNVGAGEFLKWKNTIALINTHDWQKVSDYFNSSAFAKWRGQVGERASEIVDLFKKAGVAGIVFGIAGLGAISFIIYKIIQRNAAA